METWIKYIGDATQRIVTKNDLANLGADLSKVEHVGENDVLNFLRNAAVKVEAEVAHILTTHPSLAGEFTETTDPAEADGPAPTAATPAETEATAPAQTPAAEEVAPNAGSAS